MKTIKIANKEYVFIEKKNIIVDGSNLVIHKNENGVNKTIILSDETIKFITETNSITEEIAKTIIERFEQKIGWRLDGDESKLDSIVMFYNYKYKKPIPVTFLFTTALESFYSLMDSLELDRSKNYLLIEKLNK